MYTGSFCEIVFEENFLEHKGENILFSRCMKVFIILKGMADVFFSAFSFIRVSFFSHRCSIKNSMTVPFSKSNDPTALRRKDETSYSSYTSLREKTLSQMIHVSLNIER